MVGIEGENRREVTTVVIDETKSGDWATAFRSSGDHGSPPRQSAPQHIAAGTTGLALGVYVISLSRDRPILDAGANLYH